MADGKLQQIRRSISSWSLSTVKKPKITIPKIKGPKLKIFRGGKKNRVEPKDDATALEEVKAALLKVEGDGGSQAGETTSEVIHDPLTDGQQEDQPTIVLTVHEHENPPEPPSPPPSPGLLAVNDELEFIDNDEADADTKVIEAVRPDLDYSDQWFDARGTLTCSKENVIYLDDFDDGQESRYYDVVNTAEPQEESKESKKAREEKSKTGSLRAREWVKSFDEKAESRIQRWLKLNKPKGPSSLPKSKSEIRLDSIDDPPDKWSKRDEIKLNTTDRNTSYTNYLQKEYNADVKLQQSEKKRESEKEKGARKETFKKIFKVKGKLSIKPIVDTQRPTYADTDIYIASAPYALANTSGISDKRESLDVSEDGINCTNDDIDPTGQKSTDSPTHKPEKNTDTTESSLTPSSALKQTALDSELTANNQTELMPDVVINSSGLNEKQSEVNIKKKEFSKAGDSSLPQPQEATLETRTDTISSPLQNEVRSNPQTQEATMETRTDAISSPLQNEVKSITQPHEATIKTRTDAVNAVNSPMQNEVKSTPQPQEATTETRTDAVSSPMQNDVKSTTQPHEATMETRTDAVSSPMQNEVKSTPQPHEAAIETRTDAVSSPVQNDVKSTPELQEATMETRTDAVSSPMQNDVKSTPEPQEATMETRTDVVSSPMKNEVTSTEDSNAIKEARKTEEELVNFTQTECKEADKEPKANVILYGNRPEEKISSCADQETVDVKSRESYNEKEQHRPTQEKEDVALELESTKAETKKKKISGSNFQRTIKNFAGSVFSQQAGTKGKIETTEEKQGEKKKKKGMINPFTKESLFKASSKDKNKAIKEEESAVPNTTEKHSDNKNEEYSTSTPKSINPFEDDEGIPLSDADPDIPEMNITAAEDKPEVRLDDSTPAAASQPVLDVLPSNDIPTLDRAQSESPSSQEYVSQVDSDEMLSISHESSPGKDSAIVEFVEEDGLRLRKDAFLAIKAMDVDDMTTNYYSFQSASEVFQTPMREDGDLTPTLPEKVQSVLTESISQNIQAEATPDQESQTVDEQTSSEKEKEEMIESVTESCTIENVPAIDINQSNTENEVLKEVDHVNKKNMEEIIPQSAQGVPLTVVPDAEPQECASQIQIIDSPRKSLPEEVPKLKLDVPSGLDDREPPKPSPRTKKGRYGYSTASKSPAPSITPRGTTPSSREPSISEHSENGPNDSSTKVVDDTMMATFPRRKNAAKKDAAVSLNRMSLDSGYAGPGSTCNGIPDVEPIYWEISEKREEPPRPSPRTKKSHKAPNESSLIGCQATPSPSPRTAPPENERKPLPEWINTRAPIPSPRGKKQRSLQSLPTMVPADDNMETVKKKLQMLSQEPLPDTVSLQATPRMKAKEEEQFYSGKAASISYGFTPARVLPPSPPMRVRKASQISLPAAMAAEKALNRQQKRTFYMGPEGDDASVIASPRKPRRRTDPIQGTPLSSIISAVKRLGEQVIGLSDLLAAAGLHKEATKQKTEELLTDVLYSVHSLMGGTGGGAWTVGGETGLGQSTRTVVTMEQVVQALQAAFQVSQDTVDSLRHDARNRPAPEVNLHLSVIEAKDLRPQTVKGTTNPYVIVSSPSSGISHRTRLEKDTLCPKWNQKFTIPVKNLQTEVLQLEIWHEHDPVKVRQMLTAVRDIKGMGRLVRGTTAQVQHQTTHLLGKVVVSVKDVSDRGAEDWYTLEKIEKECAKDRGSLHLEASVSSRAQLDNKSRHSYDALLVRFVHHQLAATTNNNEEGEWSTPWNGQISGAAAAALAQYAIMLDLNDAALHLAWWNIGSRVATADAAWVLSQLTRVQNAISSGLYQDEELLEIRSSFRSFIVCQTQQRLKDLHKAFPPTSGIIGRRQLTFTLKVLLSMQNHGSTRWLLDLEGIPRLHEIVTSSLATHTKDWWTTVTDELPRMMTTDEYISCVINIIKESYNFLSYASNLYNSVFLKEMNIPYMQTTYLMVSKKVNACVRPLVTNIYNRLQNTDDLGEEVGCEYNLDVGTSLWELYMSLGRLHKLGESLPVAARAESGVHEYHRWFSKGVLRWVELAVCRARSRIKKAVELDVLEPQDAFCNFSSSASDTLGIFNDVKIWWEKLAWPDPENSVVMLTKILEDISSCVISYSNLIREKVESIFHQQQNSTHAFITEQICVGLNNIERVRTEMVKLPTHFGFGDLLEKIRSTGSGDNAASQLEATVDRLIFNAAENMEAKVNEFIETVLDKMRPTLERAVNEACEAQSSRPLLAQVLDPSLELTLEQLNTSNFKRFLWRVWEVVLELFHTTVMRNTERRKANYFGGVHSILESTLKFFSPSDGKGLDEKTAQTPEYTSLMDLLEGLRMSTESLIAQYYQERYEEQMEDILPCKARLFVKMLFTKPGKLMVEVIMARDMVVEADTTSINSRGGALGHHAAHQPVDSYVKVQLVPQEWFPSAAIRKTKTQRKQDPAVYEETFEYDMSKTDDGVRAGFLLLTLKDYNLGFSNTFIGEAVVPLSSLPCVDSSQVHTVVNTCLTMTTPGLDIGYKSLRVLQFRTADKMASTFIKKVSKRLIDPKVKSGTNLRPDEDKARSKSPNLKERLRLS